MPRIALLSAGGTGGHLFPAQALAEELLSRGWEVHLATDKRAKQFLSGLDGVTVHAINSATPSVRSPVKFVQALAALSSGTISSIGLVRRVRPSIFVGFGGYPTVPPALASRLSRVPIVLHEQNAAPGRANRFLAPLSTTIARSLPGRAFHAKARDDEPGNPVRRSVLDARKPYPDRAQDEPFNLLVFGGSQGAQAFSELIPSALALLPAAVMSRIVLTMQCRPEDEETTRNKFHSLGMEPTIAAFFKDLPSRMSDAHFIIARAGASTVAELAVLGRPSLLIPYPFALDHDQAANGAVLESVGAATVSPQADLSAEILAKIISENINSPERLSSMAHAARSIAHPDAASRLADIVERDARV